MSAITLYDFGLDENCYKVRLMLAALGLPHRLVPVDVIPGGEQRRPPLVWLNPLGTLPILEDRDGARTMVLRDAEAILAYLANRYDPRRIWLPADPFGFGLVLSWLTFSARDLEAAVDARRAALFGGPESPAATARARARRAFRVMEDHMTHRGIEGGDWFVGDGPTLAEIALFPSFALARDFGVEHEAYPALRRWSRRVRALPGFMTMPGIPDYH